MIEETKNSLKCTKYAQSSGFYVLFTQIGSSTSWVTLTSIKTLQINDL